MDQIQSGFLELGVKTEATKTCTYIYINTWLSKNSEPLAHIKKITDLIS